MPPTVKNDTVPTESYIEAVRTAVEGFEEFQADGMPELLATCCWRHDQPLPKSFFESDSIKFDDKSEGALTGFIERLSAFNQDDKGNDGDTPPPMKVSRPAMPTKFNESMLKELGLTESASEAQVVQAIQALKAGQFSETERQTLQDLKNERRISNFMEQTTKLDVVPGSAREKAERLLKLEDILGKDASNQQLKDWQAFSESIEAAGVTKTLLSAYSEKDDSAPGKAEAKIRKYAEDNKVTFQKALAHFATSDLATFSEYNKEVSS